MDGSRADGAERRRSTSETVQPETRPRSAARSSRKAPFFRLLGFYVLVVVIGWALFEYVPVIHDAWMHEAAYSAQRGEGLLNGNNAEQAPRIALGMVEHGLVVLLTLLSALVLSLPVASIYTYTRRLGYDPSLVQSVIILPMVVAGIVLIVKDSVALAFSLAGIVAAVRFRNTLKDPKDAVYVFLAIGIGLAAGVQAIEIAIVMSALLNFVVLVIWKWNLGAIYSADQRRDLLSIGDTSLLMVRNAEQRDAIRWRMSREAGDMETDGILLVHSDNPDLAKQHVELSINRVADDYLIAENFRERDGISTFAVLLQLNEKKGDPLALLADLDERWSAEVLAAEYLPYRHKPTSDDKSASKDKKEPVTEEQNGAKQ